MVDTENQADQKLIESMLIYPKRTDKHLNFDINKLMDYIEQVLVFKEKQKDVENKIYYVS